MKKMHHYDRDGNYTGYSSPNGPFDWIVILIVACLAISVISATMPWSLLALVAWGMFGGK